MKNNENINKESINEYEPPTDLCLDDRLKWGCLKDGIIFIRGTIGDYTLEDFRPELHELVKHDVDIEIDIYSMGGDILAALAIYDVVRLYVEKGKKINVTTSGISASAAATIILQAGVSRKATRNTWFLLHRPCWSNDAKFLEHSDLETETEALKRLSDQVLEILSVRCGKSLDELYEILTPHKELWLNAQEALEFGLIDYIL